MPSPQTKSAFLQNCQDICDNAQHVTINYDVLKDFAKELEKPNGIYGWDNYISKEAQQKPLDITRIFLEFALITAQQSGFIYAALNGLPAKWAIKGSGAKAMVKKMKDIRDAVGVPGIDIQAGSIERKISPLLKDVPFKRQRLDIFKEFAAAAAYPAIDNIVTAAKTDAGYHFEFEAIEHLAASFPLAFGEDPYRKKAALVPLLFAAHMDAQGIKVTIDGIAAADYRLPQTLHAAGVLNYSVELVSDHENEIPLGENSQKVQEMRAATIIAVDEVCKVSGLSVQEADAALWSAVHTGKLDKYANTVGRAQKPMTCYTMRF